MASKPSFFQQKTTPAKPCSLLTRALNHNERSPLEESGSERLTAMSLNDSALLELQCLLKIASCSKSNGNSCSASSRPVNPLPWDARWESTAPCAGNLSLQTLNDMNNINNMPFITITNPSSSSFDTQQPHLSAGSAPAFNFKSITITRGRCSPVQSWPMNPSYPERLRSV